GASFQNPPQDNGQMQEVEQPTQRGANFRVWGVRGPGHGLREHGLYPVARECRLWSKQSFIRDAYQDGCEGGEGGSMRAKDLEAGLERIEEAVAPSRPWH